MKRWHHDIPNITTAAVVIFATIMEVLPPVNSQEVARLRCQKSGCRENDLEEPTLIVASSSSSSRTKFFPLLTSWIVVFLLLRLAAHYIRKLIPIIRREAPKIRAVVGHYIHSMMDLTTTGRERSSGQLRMKKGRRLSTTRSSPSSNKSLGSLAELLDDSGRSGRGTSLWYDDNDNDSSSSAGYSSSAYTSYTDDDKSQLLSAVESQSEFGSSVYSESTGSSYNYSHDNSNYNNSNNDDDDQSRGGESIVSKFLSYISESKGHHHGGYDVKRRSSVDDHSLVHDTATNADTVGLYNPKRRSTVDETNHYLTQHRSQNAAAITSEIDNQRRETLNAAVSLLTTQNKPSSSRGGMKMRKTAAATATTAAKAKSSSQDYDYNDDNGKTKSSKSRHHQQQQPQSIMQRHDKDEPNNNKTNNNSSRLHHHLSKFSSSSSTTNEDYDNEQYSTMLSTVDLRSRGTRDTRVTWNSGSFVGNK